MRTALLLLLLTSAAAPAAAQAGGKPAAQAAAKPPAQAAAPTAGLRACDRPIRYAAAYFPTPELDHGKSIAQISAAGGAAKGKGQQLGHVVVETKLSLQPQEGCAGVTVRLDFLKPVLRIASEFPKDSCAYERVLNHEHTHVRIWRDIAERFRKLEYPWPDRAKPADLMAHAQRELAYLMRAQEEFDSPEEYGRNLTVCGGEIGVLMAAKSVGKAKAAAAAPAGRPG